MTVKGIGGLRGSAARRHAATPAPTMPLGGASFDEANFRIFDRNGRGFARQMAVHPDGTVRLREVRYTSCPTGNEDWMLQASSLKLDIDAQQGVAHQVVMRFKDVPIFYTPYIAFPLGDSRQSGTPVPELRALGQQRLPARGPLLLRSGAELRHDPDPGCAVAARRAARRRIPLPDGGLPRPDRGELPAERRRRARRSRLRARHRRHQLGPGLRFDTDIASVSDSNYFQDFAVGAEQTSVTFLERRAELLYYDDVWRMRAQLQNFQTIDTRSTPATVPIRACPACRPYGLLPARRQRLKFAVSREVGRTSCAKWAPRACAPTCHRSFAGRPAEPGYFFEPVVGYHFTQYDLQNAAVGDPSTPTRTLPYARLDTGLVFERESARRASARRPSSRAWCTATCPYRNQNELPIFDTGLPDLNLVELFRTNRYVGDDRIGDANQFAMGLTTRLFNRIDGGAVPVRDPRPDPLFLAAPGLLPDEITQTLPGQTLLTIPGQPTQVILPGQNLPTLPGQTLATAPGQTSTVSSLGPHRRGVGDGVQELERQPRLPMESLHLAAPTSRRCWSSTTRTPTRWSTSAIASRQDILKQYDASFAWPIAGHWNTVGRWVYSLQDRQLIEQLAGFEYKSCCWRIQVLQRRYLTNRTGGLDTSIALQLELTGLSSVGKRSDAFLQKEIQRLLVPDPPTAS